MLSKSWTILAPEYTGQLLAQMSALRDDAKASTQNGCTTSSTSSPTCKHVSVSICCDLSLLALLTLAHLLHPATHKQSSGYKRSCLATR